MARNLQNGASGRDVRVLQRLLNFHLLTPVWKPLVTDGIFGLKTKARVIEFQQINSLMVDGIVGPQTRSALMDARELRFFANLHIEEPALSSAKSISTGFSSPLILANNTMQSGPLVPVQRTVQIQSGQQVNINPFFLQPLVLTGQFNWLCRRNGMPDVLLSAGGQFALNQQSGPKPSGGWSGQGFLQWGPTGLLKAGNFDLLNPYVAIMLQQNQGQPLGLGFGIGNQTSFTLRSTPHPTIPNADSQNISIFINGQVATSTNLKTGETSAPGLQILGGVTWTFDWTPKAKP
jgi:hypothetical protein